MRTELFVIGYPKSGTIWLSRLIGDVLNSPVRSYDWRTSLADEGYERTGPYLIRHRHSPPNKVPVAAPLVFIYRDPRALAVSRAHYWGRDLDKAVQEVAEEWPRYTRAWLKSKRPRVAVTSYENLSADTGAELADILERLHTPPVRLISDVVQRQSFESRVKMTAEAKHFPFKQLVTQRRLLRKGEVGDWRNHLSAEQERRIVEQCGELMEELGYEF